MPLQIPQSTSSAQKACALLDQLITMSETAPEEVFVFADLLKSRNTALRLIANSAFGVVSRSMIQNQRAQNLSQLIKSDDVIQQKHRSLVIKITRDDEYQLFGEILITFSIESEEMRHNIGIDLNDISKTGWFAIEIPDHISSQQLIGLNNLSMALAYETLTQLRQNKSLIRELLTSARFDDAPLLSKAIGNNEAQNCAGLFHYLKVIDYFKS